MIRYVILGLGFMGQLHARCLKTIPNVKLVGVVETNVASAKDFLRRSGFTGVVVSDSLQSLIAEARPDALDICLPTDLHRPVAEAAFAAGLHVFCEKPMALNIEDAQAIQAAASNAGRALMIGHCLRFWPEYLKLKSMIDSGEAGRLLNLSLFRRAPRPDYTIGNWAALPERCLGAALDLHIHDTDLIHFLVGSPSAVASRGIQLKTGWDYIQTQYHFPHCTVQAEGGWIYPTARGFQMGFSALFENGSLDYDSQRKTPLLKIVNNRKVDPLLETETVEDKAPPIAYRRQLEYFAECLATQSPVEINSGTVAIASLRTVLAEIQSAQTGKPITLAPGPR